MSGRTLWNKPIYSPRLSLTYYWLCWKFILLAVALICPGLGYDTSTSVLFAQYDQPRHGGFSSLVARKFVRWDAVYFTEIARRGYEFEQEWAFGWGFTRLLHLGSQGLYYVGAQPSPLNPAYTGVFLAHLCHLLSVFVLYELSKLVSASAALTATKRFSFVAASLHIISPAGVFLSAPYAESLFSLFNLCGMYLYAAANMERSSSVHQWRKDALIVASGIIFGMATTFRSNGLLSGLIFVHDAITKTIAIAHRSEVATNFRDLCVAMLAGVLMALGTLIPQYLAYMEYCSGFVEEPRPWCSSTFPSIYAWVQKHYWSVGFLRYWTVSNIPLFLLAAPMLYMMTRSAVWAWDWHQSVPPRTHAKDDRFAGKADPPDDEGFTSVTASGRNVLRRLLVPQLALALLALTSFHVQTITRFSSGYPVWYWWLAWLVINDEKVRLFGRTWDFGRIISSWMVGYALIQGGLFATFLPPA